jgi:hypothetical protein
MIGHTKGTHATSTRQRYRRDREPEALPTDRLASTVQSDHRADQRRRWFFKRNYIRNKTTFATKQKEEVKSTENSEHVWRDARPPSRPWDRGTVWPVRGEWSLAPAAAR